jgi:hypothetical protein
MSCVCTRKAMQILIDGFFVRVIWFLSVDFYQAKAFGACMVF